MRPGSLHIPAQPRPRWTAATVGLRPLGLASPPSMQHGSSPDVPLGLSLAEVLPAGLSVPALPDTRTLWPVSFPPHASPPSSQAAQDIQETPMQSGRRLRLQAKASLKEAQGGAAHHVPARLCLQS